MKLILLTLVLAFSANADSKKSALLSSPRSVEENIAQDERVLSYFRADSVDKALSDYWSWKEEYAKRTGIKFGTDYQFIFHTSDTDLTDKDGFSGIFRVYSTYSPTDNGSLTFKVENRHAYSDNFSAQDYGFEAGYHGISGTMFSEYESDGWAMTNLFWKQRFNDGDAVFLAGVIDATDYLGAYGLINPLASFMNLSFSTDISSFSPNQGLGFAIATSLGKNYYTFATINDANGDAREFGFDTFFEDQEFFSSVELGWTSSRSRFFLDNVHVNLWHVDAHDKYNPTDEDWGVNFSASFFIEDKYMPFLRLGFADEGVSLAQESVSTGIGYHFRESKDVLAVGLNWSSPAGTLRDQVTTEVFYRFQLTKNIAITPDFQYINNPALDTNKSSLMIYGVRTRVNF